MSERNTFANPNTERHSFHQKTRRRRYRLDKCRFILQLKQVICTNHVCLDMAQLDGAYEQFLSRIKQMTESEIAPIELLRQYNRASNVLHWLQAKDKNRTSEYYYYISSALSALEFERRAVLLQIEHPHIFAQQRAAYQSPLFWSKKFPLIGLTEILCGLTLLGPIVTADDSPATFTAIIRTFEIVFNVKLGNPQDIKRSVLRRNLHLTRFTDAVRSALQNYTEK